MKRTSFDGRVLKLVLDIPCNHLLLLVGGKPSTPQDFSGSGEEVKAVVLEVLIDERQEDL